MHALCSWTMPCQSKLSLSVVFDELHFATLGKTKFIETLQQRVYRIQKCLKHIAHCMNETLVCACENLRNQFQFDDGKFDEDEHTLADEIGIVEIDVRR